MTRLYFLIVGWIMLAVFTSPSVQSQSGSAAPPLPSSVNKVNTTTLTGKVMCGYQGWFAVPTDAINRGWYHYKLGNTFAPGARKLDLWPATSEMGDDEKHA